MSTLDSTLIAPSLETNSQTIKKYLREMMENFFQKLRDEQESQSVTAQEPAVDLFRKQLDIIENWPIETVEKVGGALVEDKIKQSKNNFNLQEEMKNFLIPNLCVLGDGHCSSKIVLTEETLHRWIHRLLVSIAKHLRNIPGVYELGYLERLHTLDTLINRSIDDCLIDFVQKYKKTILAQLDGDEKEEEEDDDDAASQRRMKAISLPDESASALDVVPDEEVKRDNIVHDFGSKDEAEPEVDFAPDPPQKKEDETEEERRARHEREDLEDEEIKWANELKSSEQERVRFNSNVKIAPFKSDLPPTRSILKNHEHTTNLIDESETHKNEGQ